jgi:hypothetical protein
VEKGLFVPVTTPSTDPPEGNRQSPDDVGEDGYADWWQLERLDGERLGRRTPARPRHQTVHPLGTRLDTRRRRRRRRGHDQIHGYGGLAAVVDSESGAVEFLDQGADPRDVSGRA